MTLEGNTHGFRHGGCPSGPLSGKPYSSWQAMKTRCLNENDPGYKKYGEKGITICDQWMDSFSAFYKDMGDRPEGTTIDRIDNNGNYEPGNCRWAEIKTQNRNRPSFNRMLTYNGETRCVAEWSEILGISFHAIYCRLRMGWSDEETLTRPVLEKNRKSITFNNKTMTIPGWAREINVNQRTLYNRLHNGWSISRALTEKTHRRT